MYDCHPPDLLFKHLVFAHTYQMFSENQLIFIEKRKSIPVSDAA